MPRFVAFLRAINVGGHTVKMEPLRRIFETLGHTKVETFIASGNVVFESSTKDEARLQRKIESTLRETLGYDVATFVRTEAELHKIAANEPFSRSKFCESGSTLFVGFLAQTPAAEAKRRLINAGGETDEFAVQGREIYWLCHGRLSDSKFSGARLEKTIGMATTVRNSNTVRRLAAKLGAKA